MSKVISQPVLELIKPDPGSSFSVYHYHVDETGILPYWHLHPEMEIVFIDKGKGNRHIGNHFSTYEDGDLIMLGPGIPHSNFGNRDYPIIVEVIVQINESFLRNELFNIDEFREIKKLFGKANHAISFGGETKVKVGKLMQRLKNADPFKRFVLLLDILNEMANSKSYKLLNASKIALEIHSNDYKRMSKIIEWVEQNYTQKIILEDVASLVGLTTNSFCRFFKNLTGVSFSKYLNEYRVNKACELLAKENSSISDILFRCGFNEQAYFCRQFKTTIGSTPREYRNKIRAWKTERVEKE